MIKLRIACFFWLQVILTLGEGIVLQIPNQLNHEWPGELVSFDPGGKKVPSGDLVLEVQGVTRPAQLEGGKVWSYVSISEKNSVGEKVDISRVSAHLKAAEIEPGIVLKEEKEFFIIDNGTYQFRLRKYGGALKAPVALGDLPHWCGGMRTKGRRTGMEKPISKVMLV